MKSIQYYSRASSTNCVSRTICCWICFRNLILLKASSSLARCLANVSTAFASLLSLDGFVCFAAMSVDREDSVLPACSIGLNWGLVSLSVASHRCTTRGWSSKIQAHISDRCVMWRWWHGSITGSGGCPLLWHSWFNEARILKTECYQCIWLLFVL